MTTTPANDPLLESLAKTPGIVALVGFSPKPSRPSHSVAAYLIEQGIQVYLINPICAGEEHLNRVVLASLHEVPEHIHIVDVFRRSEEIEPIIDDAIRVKADTIWLQLGISNPEAEEKARQAGLGIIGDRCLAIEHRRLKSNE
jgi:predicted CoA-binding protein